MHLTLMDNSDNLPNPKKPKLYQEHPRRKSQFRRYKSKTESRESFRLDALDEYGKLKANGTIPNHIVQVNYQVELTVKEIQALWKQHARRLRSAGIVARAAIEVTKDKWRQRPTNKVHYHFVVKDDRPRDELKELFEAVCRCEMEESTFKVNVFPFDEKKGGWKGYIAYFVKLKDKDGENILFEKGLRLRKYYTIGKWWTHKDGTPCTIGDIKEKKRQYAKTKRRLKESEKRIPTSFDAECSGHALRADQDRLNEVLDRETDETLYDWYSISLGQPALFQTTPPRWLTEKLPGYIHKWDDMLKAILERLKQSDNPDIAIALEIYHNYGGMIRRLTPVSPVDMTKKERQEHRVYETDIVYCPAEYDSERDEYFIESIYNVTDEKHYTIGEYIALQASIEGQQAHLPPITDLVPAEELQAIFGNLDRPF